ncbi:DUF6538 domain-containing protein [Jannaschia sp. KMU-145]|uniref:DUF6538 domain-containing protein n=1 Tax=Jannaschia halovivens TaxID=3388667 RepID=UPI00396B2EED
MKKVEGTIIRAGRYHANLKIPACLRARYGGKDIYRTSLKTADAATAKTKVGIIRATMDLEREAAEQSTELDRLTAALAPDQLALYRKAGGLEGLLRRFAESEAAKPFIEAARPSSQPDDEERDDEEIQIEAAEHRAAADTLQAQRNAVGKTLRALGQDVGLETVHSLRDLAEDHAASVDPQTADGLRTIVRRFTEFHGEVALENLEARHLREFVDACAGLPKVQSREAQRKMTFPQLVDDAARRNAPTISYATQRKIFDSLKGLMAHGAGRGFVTDNPWASLRLKAPKRKHSVASPRRPFTGPEVAKVLDHVRGSNEPQFGPETLDHWGPHLGAYHGLRIQEASQLRVEDFAERDGVWAMKITDEGEGQKAKTKSSVRWVPVHPAIAADLRRLVESRAGHDGFLFVYWHRYRKKLVPLEPDSRGRVSGAYAKRFAAMMDRIGLDDPALVFHSFRHRLQDAADSAGIPDSHRRYLTGRANPDAVEGGYGQGASMKALAGSLAKVDPLA